MKKIICKIIGHKYGKEWKDKHARYIYSTTHCMRCGEYKFKDQKIYFSGQNFSTLNTGSSAGGIVSEETGSH